MYGLCFIILFFCVILYILVSKKQSYMSFTYPNEKQMAYVSTWDDYHNIDDYIKLSKMNKGLVPLSMFIDTMNLDEEYIAKLNTLIPFNTIESHSITHPLNPNNDTEYIQSQKDIQRLFGQKYGTTYAYPYGNIPDNMTTVRQTYLAARTCEYGFVNSTDMHLLNSMPIEELKENDIVEAINNNYALITIGHGLDQGWRPISVKNYKKHIRYLKKHSDKIWFTTLPEFVSYLRSTGQI